MIEGRLLTTEGGYEATVTFDGDGEPPEAWAFMGRTFKRDHIVRLAGGDVVWIYYGPPAPLPPEPPPIVNPDDEV